MRFCCVEGERPSRTESLCSCDHVFTLCLSFIVKVTVSLFTSGRIGIPCINVPCVESSLMQNVDMQMHCRSAPRAILVLNPPKSRPGVEFFLRCEVLNIPVRCVPERVRGCAHGKRMSANIFMKDIERFSA